MGAVRTELKADGCAVLRLSNAARRNALDDGMLDRLLAELVRLSAEGRCRMILLEGEGEHFCAGRDLSGLDIDGVSDEQLRRDFSRLRDIAQAFRDAPKPVLCVVRGYALGLGAALVGWSDIALAACDARFGFPEVKVGIPSTFSGLSLLGRVPLKMAMNLVLTGAPVDGSEAERIGLVSRAVPTAKLEALAAGAVEAMLQASPSAIARTKALFRAAADAPPGARPGLALGATLAGIRATDAVEGRSAFREKRQPRFSRPCEGGVWSE
ncbi:enoyl-CoA hydratase/isomerase family protein [Mesorhizobium sp. M7A.F.Ca.US.006.01.1.1]|uniref:enoyl-CoA hydratase/isomerase family protein n=1 Tax=Mesorhizobium sp. M7A.F.Ca.US.006.01.1.1 TaxID=2496707 RepID=UPI000FC9A653|nr:enoyl-CoA hydratase/isomerase family protein [Mesorhizobium sp. M7A.F.Ca.US.006.01.1.1]RUZ71535.1 enoyl-CoA hydratase/isomerase family protein [Mesorhizobium sp. M7A.F.Ca.US.006.01.1.1]